MTYLLTETCPETKKTLVIDLVEDENTADLICGARNTVHGELRCCVTPLAVNKDTVQDTIRKLKGQSLGSELKEDGRIS